MNRPQCTYRIQTMFLLYRMAFRAETKSKSWRSGCLRGFGELNLSLRHFCLNGIQSLLLIIQFRYLFTMTEVYTATSRKVVGKKVNATIPKGNVGYDQFTVPDDSSFQTYSCCFPLALANIRPWPLVPFFQISLKNSELKTTHSTFRDCRVHFFRQPFWKQLYLRDGNKGLTRRVPLGLCIKTRSVIALDMKMIFLSNANKTHFHKKDRALGLILKIKDFGTPKWPTGVQQSPSNHA